MLTRWSVSRCSGHYLDGTLKVCDQESLDKLYGDDVWEGGCLLMLEDAGFQETRTRGSRRMM